MPGEKKRITEETNIKSGQDTDKQRQRDDETEKQFGLD